MPTQIASPVATGGYGTDFERDVVSWAAMHILRDNPILTSEGMRISRLNVQTRVDGWILDDMLLESTQTPGGQARVAVTVKSNPGFTRERWSPDVLQPLWEQFLNQSGGGFDPARDYLCLIVGDMEEGIYRGLRSLIQLARDCAPDQFAARMASDSHFCSADVRALWSTCVAPSSISGATEERRAVLLSRLWLIRLDFRNDHSDAKQDALTLCRDSLANPTPDRERDLWLNVREIVCQMEPISGGLTREKLFGRLRRSFELKAAPYFEADFERLLRDSNALRGQIRRHLGPNNKVINRALLISRVRAAFATNQIVFAVGASGTGKSALCSEFSDGFGWWLNATQLAKSSLSEFEQSLGISARLDKLLPCVHEPSATLCIDGLDRHEADERVWDTLATLAKVLFSAPSAGVWKLLLPLHFSSVDVAIWNMHRRNADFSYAVVDLSAWSDDEWQQIVCDNEWLPSAVQRSNAETFFRIPKITDWVLSRGQNALLSAPVDHAPLVERLWLELVVKAGNPNIIEQRLRDRLLSDLSAMIADNGPLHVALSGLSDDQVGTVESLCAAKVLRLVDSECVAFEHDLAADWSRAVFLGRSTSLEEALGARESLPRWHRAIRLLSAGCLDGAVNTPSEMDSWLAVMEQLRQRQSLRAADLWMEGIIHCQSPKAALAQLSVRSTNFDALLQRFLLNFEVSGTVPSPSILPFDRSQLPLELQTALASISRAASGTAWEAIFQFVDDQSEAITEKTAVIVCRLASIWFRSKMASPGHERTNEIVAAVVLGIAERIAHRRGGLYRDDGSIVVEATGYAFVLLPDRGRFLLRQFAGLEKPANSSEDANDTVRPRSRQAHHASGEPWPGGARWRPYHGFAHACLSGSPLIVVAKTDPQLAFEILFALLVEDADERQDRDENVRDSLRTSIFPDCALSFRCYDYPIQSGIFLFEALNFIAPIEALRFAIRLTNFVAVRWHETTGVEMDQGSSLVIPAKNDGKGWLSLFMLRKFSLDSVPHPVNKLLGALLASWDRRLSDGMDISTELELTMIEATSTAMLDLLANLGERHPSLFDGPLKDMMMCPILCQRYDWLLKALRTSVNASPELASAVNSTAIWWAEEAERRGWSDESRDHFLRWQRLALAETIDEVDWNAFFHIEKPDPISVENCLFFLRDPRNALGRGIADESLVMLVERLSLSEDDICHDRKADEEDSEEGLDEAKACAAAALLVVASLGPSNVLGESMARCRAMLLRHAQVPSVRPNGLITHSNYGILGQLNYQREEASPRGLTAYALPALLARFPSDIEVRRAYARTMFAQEIIFTDMMWKTINVLGEVLGDDYIRSYHLVLRVAAVREGNRCVGGFWTDSKEIEEATKAAAMARLESLCEQFASNVLAAAIPPWQEIISEECDPIRAIWEQKLHPSERGRQGGFDTYLMDHSQPLFCRRSDGKIDPAFHAWWERCAEYVSDCEINDEDDSHHERWSEHHFGKWCQLLAQVSMLMGDVEVSRRVWSPMLAIATKKLENVTDFLNYWWQEAITSKTPEATVAGYVKGFADSLRSVVPTQGKDIGYYAAQLWTAVIGVQEELQALRSRPPSARCPPSLLMELGPLLIATARDYPIRSLAAYLSLGISGIDDSTTIDWFAKALTTASYAVSHKPTADAILRMVMAATRRDASIVSQPSFRKLLNSIAAHPWPDAVRFQEDLSIS